MSGEYILGIAYDMQQGSSVVILRDGMTVAAAHEERFDRKKKSRRFPERALKYCLDTCSVSISDIRAVAIPWNPGVNFEKFNPLFSQDRRSRAEYLYAIPDHLAGFLKGGRRRCTHITQLVNFDGETLPLYYVQHHLAHAANALFLSPFESAAILTLDGRGESSAGMLALGQGNRISVINEIPFPHSLGSFYSTYTEYLGFEPENDEWKVMALSAFEVKNEAVLRKIRKTVEVTEDGNLFLDLSYYKESVFEQPHYYSPRLVAELGPPRQKDEALDDRFLAVAWAMQTVFEEAVDRLLHHLFQCTQQRNLVVSGGCFMNSVYNGKVLERTPFERLFISSCPDDTGVSLGAAKFVHHSLFDGKNREVMRHNYWGPEYSHAEIKQVVERLVVGAYQEVKDPAEKGAELIEKGRILGWFQGRMEFGQRALGNRSILCDPRRPEMKDRVNGAVKFREPFRPFAPAILREAVRDYFIVSGDPDVPFMERVLKFKPEKMAEVPAVVHVDGSGRLQTVEQVVNPHFYDLIDAFQRRTGVPIVLNTSFNINGEPIVCSPEDALRTFYTCGLTDLIIGNFWVSKSVGERM